MNKTLAISLMFSGDGSQFGDFLELYTVLYVAGRKVGFEDDRTYSWNRQGLGTGTKAQEVPSLGQNGELELT